MNNIDKGAASLPVEKKTLAIHTEDLEWLQQQPGDSLSQKLRGVLRTVRYQARFARGAGEQQEQPAAGSYATLAQYEALRDTFLAYVEAAHTKKDRRMYAEMLSELLGEPKDD